MPKPYAPLISRGRDPTVIIRQVPKCSRDHRTYREWSPLVVALLHPTVATVRRVCAMRARLVAHRPATRLEVLVYRHVGTRTPRDAQAGYAVSPVGRGGVADEQEALELREACSLDNHVIVHAAFNEGATRAVNRLVRMANGDRIVVAEGDAGRYVHSLAWIGLSPVSSCCV